MSSIQLNTHHVNFDIDVVLKCERRNSGPFILKLFIFIQQHGDREISILRVQSDCPAGQRMLKGSLKRLKGSLNEYWMNLLSWTPGQSFVTIRFLYCVYIQTNNEWGDQPFFKLGKTLIIKAITIHGVLQSQTDWALNQKSWGLH